MAKDLNQLSDCPRLTIWRYLCADLRAAVLLCGFLMIGVLTPLVILGREVLESGGSGAYTGIVLVTAPPLILFSLILLDVWLVVRRVNRSISEGRFVSASVLGVTRAPGSIQIVVAMSFHDGSRSFVRHAFLFQQSRTRRLSEGSVVTLPACTLARFRNPVPVEAFFDGDELAVLVPGRSHGHFVRSGSQGASAQKEHRIKIGALLLAVAFCLTIAVLLIPFTEIFFRRIEGVGAVIARSIYAVFAIVIAVSSSLKALPREPVVVSCDGVLAFGDDGRRFFKWEEIRDVLVRGVAGFRYFAVYSQDREFYAWVPFFLEDFDGFLSDVIRDAPEGNPLREEAERASRGEV